MSLSRQDVAKVGLLSRLALADAELDSLTGELTKIVGFVSQLSEVDTEKVEPLAHPLDAANVFRADEPAASLPREAVLAGAPRHDGECFLVPAVLGESGAA
jgi:aspartyl-tRNA(Asn)/glutamyl-tRNA(Gln) amidotransferase subunit C